jgi:protein-disulfide isomerase
MTFWNPIKSMPMVCARQPSGPRRAPAWLRRVPLACFACAFLSFLAAQTKSTAPPPTSSEDSEPMAIFAGQPIYENQLPAAEQVQLRKMAEQVYSVQRRALESVLDQKLVEAEAKKKGVTVAALLKAEADSKVADPTDAQVSAYYQANQGQMKQPFEEMKEKIRQGLKDQGIQKARTTYVVGLMQQAANDGMLSVLLRPPPVADMTPDPARMRGDSQAPVTILEFSDFSCPFCKKAEATLSELLAKYPGKVKVGYRDFPLRQIHPQAQLAAEASRCAGELGKYWEYHDLLFANPDKQGHDDLIEDARKLKLDDKQFDTCLTSGRYKPQIDQDVRLGTLGGVVATPGFFVNGTFVNGAQPAAVFEKIIDQKLAAFGPKQAAK